MRTGHHHVSVVHVDLTLWSELSVLVSRSREIRTFAPLPVFVSGCVDDARSGGRQARARACSGECRRRRLIVLSLFNVYLLCVSCVPCHYRIEAEKQVVISLKEICVSSLRTSSPPQRKPKGCERSDRCLRCAPHSPTPGVYTRTHTYAAASRVLRTTTLLRRPDEIATNMEQDFKKTQYQPVSGLFR